eukprot:03934.XXX_53396_54484_1 [CDS] Oithona nana genome sequencing.
MLDSFGYSMYANQLKSLPQDYYPWFDTCHVLLCVLAVRKEAGRGFAWTNPFSCWLSCIVASFAGSIICNPLLGKPILGALKDEQMIVIATLVFLAVFYTPKDVFYSTVKIVPIYAVICTLKEILRAKKIYKGLEEGRQAMPSGGSYLFIPVIIATLKGNGSGFAGPIVRFVRGTWDPKGQELVKPSVTTKLCFWSAIALTLVVDTELVYLIITGSFIAIKLSSILGESIDPFRPIENILFGILNNLTFEERVKDE